QRLHASAGVVRHRGGARHGRRHRQHVPRPPDRHLPTRRSDHAARAGRHHPPGRRMMTRHIVLGVRIVAIAALAIYALSTPGFTSQISINALLNAISFIGCVAVGMTFITLTGNIMSLCLGATVSASALIFLASLSAGILPAFFAAIIFGIVVTAI